MQVYVYHRYGPPEVLQREERETPVPENDQVLIRVHAAGVNAYDWRLVSATPFLVRTSGLGVFRPKTGLVGADIAGRIEAVGDKVTRFRVGDAVFGALTRTGNGGFANYALAGEPYLTHIPDGVSFEEAAAVPMAALTALQGLRDAGNLQAGQKVAINGSSGGVGTYAVQFAKVLGGHVTAVCSAKKADLARSLGADWIVDYTEEDFTAGSERYDLILGVNGYHHLRHYRRALTPNGTYVMAGGTTRQILQGAFRGSLMSRRSTQTLRTVEEEPNASDLEIVAGMMKAGKVRSVIDRTYPFDQVPAAVRYVSEGHAAGKVVVKVAG
jgi:NADPH:quinone reductase-like Zn-dependent oxidoreductase